MTIIYTFYNHEARLLFIFAHEVADEGLVESVVVVKELGDVLCETKVRDLCVIRAGREPRNPAELLASDRIGDLLAALKTEFTHILCDTPPVNPYTDAAVLGARMDGVLLVVRMGKTNREQAERAKHVLERAGNNVIGTFLTEVAHDSDEIDYYKRLEE